MIMMEASPPRDEPLPSAVNEIGSRSNERRHGSPAATASIAPARFCSAAARSPTYEVVSRGLISMTTSSLPSGSNPSDQIDADVAEHS